MTDDSKFDIAKKQFTAAAPNVHHLVDALEKALTNSSADLRETKFDKAYLIALQIYEQFRTTQLTNRPDIQMETSNDAHTRYGKALDRTIMDTEARPDKAEETGNIIREKIGRMLTNAVELELSLGKDHIDLAVQARKLEEMLTDFHIVMLTRESQALFAPPEEDQKKPAPAIAPRTGAPQKTQAVKPLADMTLKPFNHAAHNESLLEKLDRLTTAIDAVIASPSAEIRETAANSAMTTAMDIYKKFYAMTRNDPLTQLAAPSTLETEFGMAYAYEAQKQPPYSDAERQGTEADIQALMVDVKANIGFLRDDPDFAINNLPSQAHMAALILNHLQTAVVAYVLINREEEPVMRLPKDRKPPKP